jgi:hypothetical protein
MKAKIENQEQYEKAVKDFEEKYFNDFINAKRNTVNLVLFDTKTRNDYNCRMNFLQMEYPLNSAQSYIQDWIYNNNSKTISKNEFHILELFCKDNEQNLQSVAMAKVELEALQKIFSKIFYSNKDLKRNEIIEAFFSKIENEENLFCPGMPIKIPIEHFKVFVDRKNKSGNTYLTNEEFISFIKRAFINDKSIAKITLKIGNGERGFAVKRFYEFFTMAANEYEKTNQCRDKYLRLVTDNFNNWSYAKLKNNFTNKTKKNW